MGGRVAGTRGSVNGVPGTLCPLESLPAADMEAAITVLDGLVVRHEVEASVSRRGSARKSG